VAAEQPSSAAISRIVRPVSRRIRARSGTLDVSCVHQGRGRRGSMPAIGAAVVVRRQSRRHRQTLSGSAFAAAQSPRAMPRPWSHIQSRSQGYGT
jgi:hypothetical protein